MANPMEKSMTKAKAVQVKEIGRASCRERV